jgi:hypothetical protein
LLTAADPGVGFVQSKRAGAAAMKKAYEKPVLVKRQKLSSVIANASAVPVP